MGNAARRLTPLGGLLLVAAVLCGLIVMHGLQPSPGPAPVPSVLAMGSGHGDAPSDSHEGHAGGQVCLAFLVAGTALLLFALVMVLGWPAPVSARPPTREPPRGPTGRPRGPTLAQLCVIRV
ncbi:DUF6153 family protein [Streptosporangium saharense]|uniref:DUF6153 family protein n=1 Tax=Streptosporangium saharense TaxID=1706840 RepID=UPI00331B82B5